MTNFTDRQGLTDLVATLREQANAQGPPARRDAFLQAATMVDLLIDGVLPSSIMCSVHDGKRWPHDTCGAPAARQRLEEAPVAEATTTRSVELVPETDELDALYRTVTVERTYKAVAAYREAALRVARYYLLDADQRPPDFVMRHIDQAIVHDVPLPAAHAG